MIGRFDSPTRFDTTFIGCSHGFRLERGCHSAFEEIRSWRKVEKIYNLDIVKCFDNLDHQILLNLISKVIREPDLVSLFEEMITDSRIKQGDSEYTLNKGVAQGPISPLLMNMYLNVLDHHMAKEKGCHYLRYADNLLIGIKRG